MPGRFHLGDDVVRSRRLPSREMIPDAGGTIPSVFEGFTSYSEFMAYCLPLFPVVSQWLMIFSILRFVKKL
jgi:hypothetical protein